MIQRVSEMGAMPVRRQPQAAITKNLNRLPEKHTCENVQSLLLVLEFVMQENFIVEERGYYLHIQFPIN